jgi:peptide/nickel transport system permease protein
MGSRWYVVRRVAWALVATYLILTATFGLLVLTPDAGAASLTFEAATSGEDAEAAQQAYERRTGRSKPVLERYRNYLVNVATLHWGWSDTRSQPVTAALADAWPYTLLYGVPALCLSVVLGLAVGLYSATHRHTTADRLATLVAFLGLSVPNFWLGIVLILLFAVELGWVPVVFDPSLPTFSPANARQLVLPVLTLATSTVAGQMRYARAETMEYLRAPFVTAARSKGVSERRVLGFHVLRPALVPLITVLVSDLLGVVVTASYLVEYVFGIPGIARLNYRAIVNGDTALVLGTTTVFVLVAVLGNLLQDLAYTVLDPRIDYGDRS